ncbi:MAG: hypothetical protein HRT38_02640 [Alteromonadaceae bacterium]|nr:hypothetical protein [Alteromonadaceae bacterium]
MNRNLVNCENIEDLNKFAKKCEPSADNSILADHKYIGDDPFTIHCTSRNNIEPQSNLILVKSNTELSTTLGRGGLYRVYRGETSPHGLKASIYYFRFCADPDLSSTSITLASLSLGILKSLCLWGDVRGKHLLHLVVKIDNMYSNEQREQILMDILDNADCLDYCCRHLLNYILRYQATNGHGKTVNHIEEHYRKSYSNYYRIKANVRNTSLIELRACTAASKRQDSILTHAATVGGTIVQILATVVVVACNIMGAPLSFPLIAGVVVTEVIGKVLSLINHIPGCQSGELTSEELATLVGIGLLELILSAVLILLGTKGIGTLGQRPVIINLINIVVGTGSGVMKGLYAIVDFNLQSNKRAPNSDLNHAVTNLWGNRNANTDFVDDFTDRTSKLTELVSKINLINHTYVKSNCSPAKLHDSHSPGGQAQVSYYKNIEIYLPPGGGPTDYIFIPSTGGVSKSLNPSGVCHVGTNAFEYDIRLNYLISEYDNIWFKK